MLTTHEMMLKINRLHIIEAKYSTEAGATEEERKEAQDIVEDLLLSCVRQLRS